MNADKVDKINKLDAARRQLVEAIWLFFHRRDPVAIHTLVGASHQLLYDLAKAKDFKSFIKDFPALRPERKKDWIAIINKAQNFFKHANKDPSDEFDFRQEFTRFLLIDALDLYRQLAGEMFHEGKVYQTWFTLTYKDFLVESELKKQLTTLGEGVDPDDFDMLCELLELKTSGS